MKEYYSFIQKEDWKGITDFIVSKIPFEDRVIFQPDWFIQNYVFYAHRMYGGRIRNINPQNPKKTWLVVASDYKPTLPPDGGELVLVKTFPGYISIWREKSR